MSTQLELRVGRSAVGTAQWRNAVRLFTDAKRSGDCAVRDAGELRVGGRALELYGGCGVEDVVDASRSLTELRRVFHELLVGLQLLLVEAEEREEEQGRQEDGK